MTAQQLATDPEFRVWIDHWVKKRWCPLPFVDWLMDHDELALAETVRWACGTRYKQRWHGRHIKRAVNVYPAYADYRRSWFWTTEEVRLGDADELPLDISAGLSEERRQNGNEWHYPSAFEAIVDLLDAYAATRGRLVEVANP